jgi:hypothetical protein
VAIGEKFQLNRGTFVDPRRYKITMSEWCDTWLQGHGTKRVRTVRQAKVHIGHIKKAFGNQPIGTVRASQVKTWLSQLKSDGYADSTIYALHSRLSQLMSDAVLDELIPKSPCFRRTAPPMGKQKPYVATTEQGLGAVRRVAGSLSTSRPPGRLRWSADR